MNSLSFPFPLMLAFPALILSSCIESDSAYILNQNGSGKVTHQVKFKKTAGNWTDEEPDRTFAMGIVRGTQGVAAWDDVHYRMADSGQAVEFRGTAFFGDINQVSLGSFLQEGKIQELPVPQVRMQKRDGKHVFTLKDPPESKTEMKITVGGVPVPSDKEEGEEAKNDEGLKGLGTLMAASFALSSDIKTSIQVQGKVVDARGFTIDDSGRTATFHYQPNAGDKKGKEAFEKRFEETFGETPQKEVLDQLFADGIFENEKLQKVVTGETPPMTATLEIEEDSFAYDVEVAKAEIKLTKEEAAGWKKLESLDP